MDKETFINKCLQSGYCCKRVAKMYCENKDTLTDNDFIEVFRIAERAKEVAVSNEKYHKVEGVKTTKMYEHRGC